MVKEKNVGTKGEVLRVRLLELILLVVFWMTWQNIN
jgi:hypothetical protein